MNGEGARIAAGENDGDASGTFSGQQRRTSGSNANNSQHNQSSKLEEQAGGRTSPAAVTHRRHKSVDDHGGSRHAGLTTPKSPSHNVGARLRARLGSGDLLLKESADGLIMSPALHRRRQMQGLSYLNFGQPSRDSREAPSSLPTTADTTGVNSSTTGADVPGGVLMITELGDGNDGDGSRMSRQRSSTWDEHEVMAGSANRKAVARGGLVRGGSGGRQRTWSHHSGVGYGGGGGDGGGGGGVEARPSADWDHLDAFQAMGSMFQQELYHEKSSNLVEVLADKVQVPLLIILVGILAAVVGMFVDYCCSSVRLWRVNLALAQADLSLGWLLYGTISLSLTLAMCAVTHYVCPCASGGGVPEMKAVLSGAGRPGLLSPQLVVVKIMGVVAANAAGLSVGKEGPLIHITCAMADILMTTPMFRKVRLNTMKRLEILACACAAGVAATFGSVFGGTLFSVEVTATAYMVETLPATFLSAVVVAVVFWLSGESELFTLINDNTAQAQGFTGADLVAWSILGVLCGLVGAGFVAALDALSRRRNFFTRKDLDDSARKRRMFVVVALCTLLVIPAAFTEAISFSVANPARPSNYLPLIDQMYDQREFGMSWNLMQLLGLKVWATVFSVVQPIPVGLFSPVFIIGGLMGRIFGECANLIDTHFDIIIIHFQPWEFALIGSAAFAAGVTRAVSTAVIVFELSGENHLRLPLGVALMISYFIANRFTKGVYDALMDTNGTPHLQEVSPKDRNVPAEDVMIPVDNIPCLSLSCTGKDASEVAALCQPGQVIPVVQSMGDKVLVGVVLWNDLVIALADYRRRGSAPSIYSKAPSSVDASATTGAGVGVGEGIGASLGRSDSVRSVWPKLAEVADAVGKRVGWLPRMPMAEPALLEQLDMQRTEEGDETGEGGDDCLSASGLAPLGPGIPFVSGVEAGGDNGENAPLLQEKGTTRNGVLSGQSFGTTTTQRETRGQGGAPIITDGRLERRAATAAANKKTDRARLRFYLVREGHKFVAVGRLRQKGAWKELPDMRAAPGVPIVLDPSPYQVTHTTELSKVDMAFRLLRLDNAYVCNAGRLVGVVTRDSLQDFMGEREVTPMDECMSMCGQLACCLPGRQATASLGNPEDTVGGNGGLFQSRNTTVNGDRTVSANSSNNSSSSNVSFARLRRSIGAGANVTHHGHHNDHRTTRGSRYSRLEERTSQQDGVPPVFTSADVLARNGEWNPV